MRKWLWIVGVAALLLVAIGCATYVDPETGEKLFGLSPAADKAVMAVGEQTEEKGGAVVAIVSAINPVAGVIAALAATTIGSLFKIYKKYRPEMLAMTDRLTKVSLGARAAGAVIEETVKPLVAEWPKAKKIMNEAKRAGAINPDELATG